MIIELKQMKVKTNQHQRAMAAEADSNWVKEQMDLTLNK